MDNHRDELVQIKASPASSRPQLTLQQVRERLAAGTGKKYWRSLEELVGEPGFEELLENEFPAGAAEYQTDGVSRRNFMKLMGASMALAGLTACTRQPDEPIVPYVRQPEDLIPGIPKFFATSMPFPTGAIPLLVKSNEFRPTKIEGNPQHPASNGATDVFAQASILDLYDPDRSQNSSYRGEHRNWGDFHDAVDQYKLKAAASGGAGLRFLSETVISPTLASQMQIVLKKFPNAKWYQWDPVNRDSAHAASQALFGQYAEPVYKFEAANVVVSLDADFLSGAHFPGFLRYSRDFMSRRKLAADVPMNRLYAVESFHTTAGALSDNRLPLRASDIPGFATALAAALGVGGAAPTKSWNEDQQKFLAALAKDLKANAGASIVLAGEQQSPELHVIAAQINQALGNVGKTVIYTDPVELVATDQTVGMRQLVADMNGGKVDMLVILNSNPAFTAPVDLGFEQAMSKVENNVHLSCYRNETTRVSQWHIHGAHYLETWSDARAYDGTCSIVQPLIASLYDGHSAHEVVGLFSDTPEMTPYEAITTYWRQNGKAAGGFDTNWRKWLHDGVIPNTASPVKSVTPRGGMPAIKPLDKDAVEVVFRPDPTIYDGRYANNAWLQECPKPLLRLEWDNAAMMSIETAAKHGFNQEDIIRITVDGRTLEAPVLVVYGMPDNSITLHLGYGREFAGRVGNGYGFNAYAIRSSNAPLIATAQKIEKTGDSYKLAVVQNFTLIDPHNDPKLMNRSVQGSEAVRRDIIRVGSYDEYKKDPDFAHGGKYEEEPAPDDTLYSGYDYTKGYQWGMAIDMNSCVGCNACVIACQAENNSPVVGKEQVKIGRDMKWLRIDAYYTGDLHNPRAFLQPMMCQHCENAPCEPVCPVGATVHTPEGLNVMVYNRCVGTRYCSNNCPYKVRRFNWMLFSDYDTPSLKPLRNPDVSVRSRGVMEKCTYCVQRINAARIQAEVEEVQLQEADPKAERRIRDGEVVTACQQACPTDAIVFGDINDPNSRVTKIKAQPRNYGVLTQINTRPRTSYIANVINPNMEIGDRTGAPGKSYISGAES
jgi:molybdopterin-containing oxidoreductase family iron-sulfur binding subunit